MKRMKTAATLLFLLALTGAFIAFQYRETFWGGLLFAVCGSALVGALADWFAVVALFRHPLGLKFIPHTAIIPNNRARIIEGIAAIVEKDWLSLDFIQGKIQDYPLIDRLAAALETENGRKELDRLTWSAAAGILRGLNPEDVTRVIKLLLKDHPEEIRLSPALLKELEDLIKNRHADDLLRILLDFATHATQGGEFERTVQGILSRAADDYAGRGHFFRRLGKGLGESLDILNYQEAGATIAHRINDFLIEMKQPGNQYYDKVKAELLKLKLLDPKSASAVLGGMLRNMLDGDAGQNAVTGAVAALKAQLLSGSRQDMPVIRNLTDSAVGQLNRIRMDEKRKALLESRVKTELSKLLERYHGVIGRTVREKLESLNDKGLVKSLEDKVGDDLQWIRINGTVIGGFVGALQFLIFH